MSLKILIAEKSRANLSRLKFNHCILFPPWTCSYNFHQVTYLANTLLFCHCSQGKLERTLQGSSVEDGGEYKKKGSNNMHRARMCLKVTEVVILCVILLLIIGLFTIPTGFYVAFLQIREVNNNMLLQLATHATMIDNLGCYHNIRVWEIKAKAETQVKTHSM